MLCYSSRAPALRLSIVFILYPVLLPSATPVSFSISQFNSNASNIIYQGDSSSSRENIQLNRADFLCRVGWATFAEPVHLYDSTTRNLTDFTTHFTFSIDTLQTTAYGNGFAFFLAPVNSHIPPNSAGGFLGLFNTTTIDSTSRNQIIAVELDTFPNPEWDPSSQHVGINVNTIRSEKYVPWNFTDHDMEIGHVWVSYSASSKRLNVFLTYESNPIFRGNSTLFHDIDLREVLPEWVSVGFSAATGSIAERNTIRSWEFSSSLEGDREQDRDRRIRAWVVGLAVSLGVLMCVVGFGGIFWLKKRKTSTREKKDEENVNLTSINSALERGAWPKRFSYQELASATNNFSDDKKLGRGGFGYVYKGYLNDLDLAIAVKKIARGSKQGRKEYITEVKIISKLRHRNLVQLIGWCHDRGEFLLVYEFMPNGSLDLHLFSQKNLLAWAVRYKVALGIASGLLYLHEEWEQCVVHRDVKSSNVMLDSGFNAKLGDFGLARLMDHELGPQTTVLAGTLGYLAPECITSGKASRESDVYSFGIVCLEISCGRKAVERNADEGRMRLVEWVWELYGSGSVLEAVDVRLNLEFDVKQIERLMLVGLWCAHPDHSLRPSIRQAIQVLNFEAEMPRLPHKMPAPMYGLPSSGQSSEPSITNSSLEMGR